MTETLVEADISPPLDASELQASITALSSSLYSRPSTSLNTIYKRASTLFLTRRLGEAYELVNNLIKSDITPSLAGSSDLPLLQNASRGQRVKIWCLYLSLVDELVKIGSVNGASFVGLKVWQAISEQVTSGKIWDYLIQTGYEGKLASVDEEVLSSMVALSLAHGQNQKLTQERLESFFLEASSPEFDVPISLVAKRADRGQKRKLAEREVPRATANRIKLLELYILHVLPRNEQWEYAKDFTKMQSLLDAERQKNYIRILNALEEDRSADRIRRRALRRQRKAEKRRNPGAPNQSTSDDASDTTERPRSHEEPLRPSTADSAATGPPMRDLDPCPTGYVSEADAPQIVERHQSRPPSPILRPKDSESELTRTLRQAWTASYERLLELMQVTLGRRTSFARVIMLLVALLLAFGNARVRQRLKQTMKSSWGRIVETLRMGTKVSYL